jgi:hypothetical protein
MWGSRWRFPTPAACIKMMLPCFIMWNHVLTICYYDVTMYYHVLP